MESEFRYSSRYMNLNDKLVLVNKNTLESLEETEILPIVERFVQTGIEVLSADFGFMFWKLDNQDKYHLIYKSPETPYEPKLPRKRGYNHKATLGRIPYFVSEPKRDLLPFMKSLAIIPIFYKSHQYGNIVLCFKKKREFKAEEKPLVMTLGNSAAQVLTIHRSHKKAERVSQKLLRQKDEFFNMVSHELKTPATTIKGFSQMLLNQEGGDEAKARHYLEKINTQVDKLSRLINDLLDVSRIGAGQVMLYRQNFELSELVEQVVESLKVSITSHILSFESAGQIWVRGDSERIEGVVINLITNAAKYSPSQSEIKVRLRESEGQACVEVEDFGYGIPKKDREKVFQRFFRSKASNKKNSSGLGLGLYIASSVVKQHGGVLGVKGKKGSKGMIFYLTLPYYKSRVGKKT